MERAKLPSENVNCPEFSAAAACSLCVTPPNRRYASTTHSAVPAARASQPSPAIAPARRQGSPRAPATTVIAAVAPIQIQTASDGRTSAIQATFRASPAAALRCMPFASRTEKPVAATAARAT